VRCESGLLLIKEKKVLDLTSCSGDISLAQLTMLKDELHDRDRSCCFHCSCPLVACYFQQLLHNMVPCWFTILLAV